jgi:spermidine synthase
VWSFKSTTAGNTIVLAFQTPPSVNANDLFLQAQAIEKRWSLPATKWLKVLAPI